MNNHPVLEVAAVLAAWISSAVFTFILSSSSLLFVPVVKKLDENKDHPSSHMAKPIAQTRGEELKVIEKKLEKAEDDILVILELVQKRQAVEKAKELDDSEAVKLK